MRSVRPSIAEYYAFLHMTVPPHPRFSPISTSLAVIVCIDFHIIIFKKKKI